MNTNKRIQNRNSNLYFSQLFPNINEANNIKEDISVLEKSMLNKDDWFKRMSDRLNRFIRLENDNYEKPRLNYSYTSKDIAAFNHSLDITKFSTNDLVKTFGQEDENASKYKKRKSIVSEREKLNKSVKNVMQNPLNLIHEIEYSDDVNFQITKPNLKKYSKKKISRKNYAEQIRSRLFSSCYHDKKKAFSTNRLTIEYRDKNNHNKKNTTLKLSTKSIMKKHDNLLNNLSPRFSSPILNKNYLSKGEDIYNTPLFLEDIELLININNQASMETYTSALKFKTEKKKSFNTIKSRVTSSTRKSYANVILDHYKKSSLVLPSEIPKSMNQHNSVFSLKEEVMILPKFEKTDIIKSIQCAQINVPEFDKSSINNTRKNNFEKKSNNNTFVIKDKTYEESESGLNMQGLKALLRKKRLIENNDNGQRSFSYKD
jgi:hypothetical protein